MFGRSDKRTAWPVARMERQRNPGTPVPHYAEFIIGPAHRVRPEPAIGRTRWAGPMAGSGRTRWLHAGYCRAAAVICTQCVWTVSQDQPRLGATAKSASVLVRMASVVTPGAS